MRFLLGQSHTEFEGKILGVQPNATTASHRNYRLLDLNSSLRALNRFNEFCQRIWRFGGASKHWNRGASMLGMLQEPVWFFARRADRASLPNNGSEFLDWTATCPGCDARIMFSAHIAWSDVLQANSLSYSPMNRQISCACIIAKIRGKSRPRLVLSFARIGCLDCSKLLYFRATEADCVVRLIG